MGADAADGVRIGAERERHQLLDVEVHERVLLVRGALDDVVVAVELDRAVGRMCTQMSTFSAARRRSFSLVTAIDIEGLTKRCRKPAPQWVVFSG